ncbi:MAG: hypothetical protein IPM15_14650 [Betaproteobacteria bacterium]|nr:hypothetical protein [Betaproteobacteria bacterium]MCC6250026.1 hypothetical protein [Rubrivivax sp.]MCL4698354.1 hypothetical protein [Burkholderiaceae bacterium]
MDAQTAQTPPPATPEPGGFGARAAERCEAEVERTLRRIRGNAVQEVQFVAGRRVLTPAGDDETSVRGAGRYRMGGGAVPFTYSCAYNARTDSTSGAVFRDAVAQRAPVERPFEPDLSRLSPEACESAVAGLLKTRHPRVGRINFGSDSRRIEPAERGLVRLVGQGGVQRAPGMFAAPFTYRCEIDPRNGRVVDVQASE